MIPIRNVYYMFSYAYDKLNETQYNSVDVEAFKNCYDMYCAVLVRATALQVNRGLNSGYIEKSETTTMPHGRIDIGSSIKSGAIIKNKLVCDFDDYTENSYLNRIIKTTFLLALNNDISSKNKDEIKMLLRYFANVDTISPKSINWRIRYDRNNQYYQLIISICKLLINEWLQTTVVGNQRLMDFENSQKDFRLYERFILAYYRKEFGNKGISANAKQIRWQLIGTNDDKQLPIMQSDILLSYGDKTLIIDAKYYSRNMQKRFDKYTYHSGNIYQIFTYVKNLAFEQKESTVSGMLLYARTDEEVQAEGDFNMSGNRIQVKNLDLNVPFESIKLQLNSIIEEYFNFSIEQ